MFGEGKEGKGERRDMFGEGKGDDGRPLRVL